MTLPVFRADGPLSQVAVEQTVTLTGAEAKHAATVQRLQVGEALNLVDGRGLRATGDITQATRERVVVRITAVERSELRVPRLSLIQALAKGDRDLQAVESCTELGVDAVVAWQADRSVARFRPDKVDRQLAKWHNTIATAAKQSRRSWWPELRKAVDTKDLVALMHSGSNTLWIVLHETAESSLVELITPREELLGVDEVAVVVGPEGGISDREMAEFTAAGARSVLLGPEVLRSSSAGAAAMVLLNVATGRWA